MMIRIKNQRTHPYITSSKLQCADALHIIHNAHVYGPMETSMALLHSAHNSQ